MYKHLLKFHKASGVNFTILHSTTVESTRPKMPTNVPVRVQTEILKQPAKISSEYYTKSVDERKKHELTRESRLGHN